MYTIAYSTRLYVYTRASLTDILARKSARVGQVGGQVGEDRRACPARGKLNGHADILATILARKSARMSVSVSVSVSVPWTSSFRKFLYDVSIIKVKVASRFDWPTFI